MTDQPSSTPESARADNGVCRICGRADCTDIAHESAWPWSTVARNSRPPATGAGDAAFADWQCEKPDCGAINYIFRVRCRLCKTPRTPSSTPASEGTPIATADEVQGCLKCRKYHAEVCAPAGGDALVSETAPLREVPGFEGRDAEMNAKMCVCSHWKESHYEADAPPGWLSPCLVEDCDCENFDAGSFDSARPADTGAGVGTDAGIREGTERSKIEAREWLGEALGLASLAENEVEIADYIAALRCEVDRLQARNAELEARNAAADTDAREITRRVNAEFDRRERIADELNALAASQAERIGELEAEREAFWKAVNAARLNSLANMLDRLADGVTNASRDGTRRDANYLRTLAVLSRSTSTGK